jgi:hypothetical protein
MNIGYKKQTKVNGEWLSQKGGSESSLDKRNMTTKKT